MLNSKRIHSVFIGLVATIALAGCGGGGGDSPQATSTTVDLGDPETALKVSSVLLGSSPVGPSFSNSAWTVTDWAGATRTDTNTCRSSTLTIGLTAVPTTSTT